MMILQVGQLSINKDASTTAQKPPMASGGQDALQGDEAPDNGSVVFLHFKISHGKSTFREFSEMEPNTQQQ